MSEMKRKTVFPVRIVRKFGLVSNAESLLSEKPLQITTDEPDCAVFENSGGVEKAGVLLDFGKEMNAAPRILTFLTGGARPARVRIVCGESAQEALSDIGEKNATNDHALRDYEIRLSPYSDMTFSESGFRFLCIRLESENAVLRLKAAVAEAVYRDIPRLGSFRCSDETLNRIDDTAAYTCHLNMQQYIWDGIKRDRLVWAGDMHPEMLTVRTVFGRQKVFEDSLRFMRDRTPLPGWMNGMPTYSLWWIIMLRDWYMYTGDRDFLAENREYAVGLSRQIAALTEPDGEDHLPSYFLDWPCHGKPQEKEGSRSLLALALKNAVGLALEYGEEALAAECREKAEAVCRVPVNTYGAKQVAAISALAGRMDADAAAEQILSGGARGFSTFMSFYLLKTAGKKDMAAALNVLSEYYGGMLDMGATTFWEDFDVGWLENAAPIDEPVPEGMRDIHGDNGAYCYKGFRHSLCHGWSSAVTAFLAEEVLGIHILSPGCRKISLRPSIGSLSYAQGTYPTPLGLLRVFCRRAQDGSTETEFVAPDGMTVILEK